MCVIYLAFETHPEHPLILLANRDEFYDRPSQAAHYWEDEPDIFAGRDLVGGGTWLGVSRTGRFAAVTNYRDPAAPLGTRSRGELGSNFLRSHQTAAECLASESSIGTPLPMAEPGRWAICIYRRWTLLNSDSW